MYDPSGSPLVLLVIIPFHSQSCRLKLCAPDPDVYPMVKFRVLDKIMMERKKMFQIFIANHLYTSFLKSSLNLQLRYKFTCFGRSWPGLQVPMKPFSSCVTSDLQASVSLSHKIGLIIMSIHMIVMRINEINHKSPCLAYI